MISGILLAPRVAKRFFDDVNSMAEGATHVAELARNIGRVADAVEGVEARMGPLDDHVDGLQNSFERSNEELAKIRHAFTPYFAELGRDIAEVRDVAEPLQGAAERVGKVVERLPGPGRRQ
jgi:methyl-accepting chemotaxis protein